MMWASQLMFTPITSLSSQRNNLSAWPMSSPYLPALKAWNPQPYHDYMWRPFKFASIAQAALELLTSTPKVQQLLNPSFVPSASLSLSSVSFSTSVGYMNFWCLWIDVYFFPFATAPFPLDFSFLYGDIFPLSKRVLSISTLMRVSGCMAPVVFLFLSSFLLYYGKIDGVALYE